MSNLYERLLEALSADDIMDIHHYAKEQGIDITKRIEGRYDKWFDGEDIVYLNFETSTKSRLFNEINSLLQKVKYTISDWKKGRCTNVENSKIEKSIASVLTTIKENYFENVKAKAKFRISGAGTLDDRFEYGDKPPSDMKLVTTKINGKNTYEWIPIDTPPIGAGDSNADKKWRFIKAVEQHYATSGEIETNDNVKDKLIAISRHHFDIARQAYKQSWDKESCKRLTDGGNRHYIKPELAKGVLVAYVINSDDLSLDKPLLRSLIIPYVNSKNPSDIFLRISDRKYPLLHDFAGFTTTVQTWLDSKQGYKIGMFRIDDTVYQDTNPSNVDKMDYDELSIDDKLDLLGLVRI